MGVSDSLTNSELGDVYIVVGSGWWGEVGRCFPWCEYMGNEFAIDSAGKNSKLFTTYGLGVPLGVCDLEMCFMHFEGGIGVLLTRWVC